MNDDIYEPREDSFLMQEAIRKIIKKSDKVLEIGTGSGILAFEAARIARHIDATDINRSALEFVKAQIRALNFNNISVFYSDLFENVNSKYDLIIFNPPYLPSIPPLSHSLPLPKRNEIKDWAVDGGKEGNEIIKKFISQASSFLKPRGRILFCCSSLSNPKAIEAELKRHNFKFKIIARKPLFFEELFVYLARKNEGKEKSKCS
ncbi:MAG: methyltransferase [Candidatus Pacearchaeota archaeon]